MIDIKNLKKCPFCGGQPYLERSHRAFINTQTTRVALVRCSSCEARTGRFAISEYGTSAAVSKAVEAWNARVEEDKKPTNSWSCPSCGFELSDEVEGIPYCPICGEKFYWRNER